MTWSLALLLMGAWTHLSNIEGKVRRSKTPIKGARLLLKLVIKRLWLQIWLQPNSNQNEEKWKMKWLLSKRIIVRGSLLWRKCRKRNIHSLIDVLGMLEDLLKLNLIELLQMKCLEEVNWVDDPYWKYHDLLSILSKNGLF